MIFFYFFNFVYEKKTVLSIIFSFWSTTAAKILDRYYYLFVSLHSGAIKKKIISLRRPFKEVIAIDASLKYDPFSNSWFWCLQFLNNFGRFKCIFLDNRSVLYTTHMDTYIHTYHLDIHFPSVIPHWIFPAIHQFLPFPQWVQETGSNFWSFLVKLHPIYELRRNGFYFCFLVSWAFQTITSLQLYALKE